MKSISANFTQCKSDVSQTVQLSITGTFQAKYIEIIIKLDELTEGSITHILFHFICFI